ncbi:MAG: hypothetical protein IJU07_08360 [Synergistaceae bacterium]|nr:hypothetical protein [Synergistaceae bacterium]
MSEFVTGFIELDYYNFDSRNITMGELIKFGIWHNYMHNWDSDRKLIEQVENDSYNCAVSAKNVEAAVRKYFALPVKHQNINIDGFVYPYKNGMYYFNAADGVPSRAEVQEATKKGNVITMRGKIVFNNVDDEDEILGEFVATAKPHKWKGKNTWVILSLKSIFYEE